MTKINSKRRSPARSGIARRRVITTTFENFEDWVAANNANYDVNNLRKKASEFLALWEKSAFEVFRRNGLPTFYSCWKSGPDGEWRPTSERPDGPSKVGERFTYVDTIGAEAAPADSEIGFATAILKRTQDARRRLEESDDPKVYRAFIDAALIAQDFDLLHMEFGMASLLGPGRKQAAGRRQGGLARARAERPLIAARHSAWRAENAKLSSTLSLRSRAHIIAARLKDTEHAGAEATIRKVIAKTGA